MTTPSPHLLFSAPAPASPHLVFGAESGAAIPGTSATIAARLGGVRASTRAAVVVRAQATARLGGVRVSMAATYDNRLTRYLQGQASAAQQVAQPQRQTLGDAWATSATQRTAHALPWTGAAPDAHHAAIPQAPADPRASAPAAPWQGAAGQQQGASAPHQRADAHQRLRAAPWQAGTGRHRQSASPAQAGIAHRQDRAATWQPARPAQRRHAGRSGASLRLAGIPQILLRWQASRAAPPGLSSTPVIPPGEACYTPSPHLLFGALAPASPHLVFICERASPLVPALVTIPIRRAYVTINSIELRRVDGNIAIPAHTFGMSLDVDSWTWSWSATLPADTQASLQPATSGDPVEVEARINGVPYRLLVESVSRDRQFGQTRISVRGRGAAAVLDAPYAPVMNFGGAVDRTAQQLMGDALTVNGVSLGWDLDWQLTDWLVPAGAWSHQGSYLSAVKAIAEAAGGYLQPHATAPTLRILPRYPHAPWAWDTVTPDIELPASVMEVEGVEWVTKPAYERVYVSGVGQGVLGQVTRAGSAGALVAPMVTDALITHADAARQRGLAVLADTGRQAHVSLKLPVLPETGLILPGLFLRHTDGADSVLGLVRSTSVEWGRPKLRQALTLETHDV